MNAGADDDALLDALVQKDWRIVRSHSDEPLLPAELRGRYPRVPLELTRFLEALESGTNADESIWFCCRSDYRRTDESGFRWNEFELMSLEGAEGNPEEQAGIRRFWDRYLPFMLAVHSDYDYLAVDLDEQSFGAVVHGSGPTFEEATVIAPSFPAFLVLLEQAAAGRDPDYPLSVFV